MLLVYFLQSCKRAEHNTYRPLNDRRLIFTTLMTCHYLRDEFRYAFDPPYFVDKIEVEDRVSDSFDTHS